MKLTGDHGENFKLHKRFSYPYYTCSPRPKIYLINSFSNILLELFLYIQVYIQHKVSSSNRTIISTLLQHMHFIFLIFIVIQLQLSAFSPHPSTPPQLNPPPYPTSTLPLGFVHVSFIVVPVIPSSHCPRPWLLLDCS